MFRLNCIVNPNVLYDFAVVGRGTACTMFFSEFLKHTVVDLERPSSYLQKACAPFVRTKQPHCSLFVLKEMNAAVLFGVKTRSLGIVSSAYRTAVDF